MMHAIPAPGAGAAAGVGLAAAQSGALGGGEPRLQAQAAVLAGIASGTLGVVAIASGASVAVMLSGALAVAAAPASVVLSGLYLAQGGKGLGARQYGEAMEILGVVSSAGSLLGFTAKALSGGSYRQAVVFGQGAGLLERVLAVGAPADLAGGFELGALAVEGGSYLAERAPEVLPPQLPKPAERLPRAPEHSPERGGFDRDTDGQRRAERMRAERDAARERPAPASKESIGKPGGGDRNGGGRNGGKDDAGKRDGGKPNKGSGREKLSFTVA